MRCALYAVGALGTGQSWMPSGSLPRGTLPPTQRRPSPPARQAPAVAMRTQMEPAMVMQTEATVHARMATMAAMGRATATRDK